MCQKPRPDLTKECERRKYSTEPFWKENTNEFMSIEHVRSLKT